MSCIIIWLVAETKPPVRFDVLDTVDELGCKCAQGGAPCTATLHPSCFLGKSMDFARMCACTQVLTCMRVATEI
jgi:hypothetical protein